MNWQPLLALGIPSKTSGTTQAYDLPDDF